MTLGPDSRGQSVPSDISGLHYASKDVQSRPIPLNITSHKQQATMAQPPHNPLLHPPFFEIPGINPSSPLSTQMEQIDQLNTLLLQEIDANFAKFHQIVTARILPEIKRFAIAGEPTREAAHVSYLMPS
jgi:hypothetical protein